MGSLNAYNQAGKIRGWGQEGPSPIRTGWTLEPGFDRNGAP